MEFGAPDGGEDDEYSNIGFVEISKIYAMQGAFFSGTVSVDKVYSKPLKYIYELVLSHVLLSCTFMCEQLCVHESII